MPFIEKALPADVPELNILINHTYRGEASKKGWASEADLLDGQRTDEVTLAGYFTDDSSTLFKYTNNEGLIKACVYLKKSDRGLYLGMLTVDPYLQNGGIGKLLLNRAEEYALEIGCHVVWMTVISVRETLIAYYERKGYVLTGEEHPFHEDPKFGIPRQPLTLLVLQKTLNQPVNNLNAGAEVASK